MPASGPCRTHQLQTERSLGLSEKNVLGEVEELDDVEVVEDVGEAAEGPGEADRPGAPGIRPQSRQPSRGTGSRSSTGLPPMGTVRTVRSSAPWRMTLADWQWEQRSCLGSC